jgi:hypothetical protein
MSDRCCGVISPRAITFTATLIPFHKAGATEILIACEHSRASAKFWWLPFQIIAFDAARSRLYVIIMQQTVQI